MIRSLWTVDEVKLRLGDAAKTLKSLPLPHRGKPRRGYGSGWPEIVRDAKEAYGWYPQRNFSVVPPAKEIEKMEETLKWLFWISKEELPIVWARSSGMTWRRLEDIDGRSRPTIKAIYDLGVATIQTNLNRETVHAVNTKK